MLVVILFSRYTQTTTHFHTHDAFRCWSVAAAQAGHLPVFAVCVVVVFYFVVVVVVCLGRPRPAPASQSQLVKVNAKVKVN